MKFKSQNGNNDAMPREGNSWCGEYSLFFKVFLQRKQPTGNPLRRLKEKGPEEDGGSGSRKGKERTLHVARPRPLPAADLHWDPPRGMRPACELRHLPAMHCERASRRQWRRGRAQAAALSRPLWPLSAQPPCDLRAPGGPPLLWIGLQGVLNNIPAGASANIESATGAGNGVCEHRAELVSGAYVLRVRGCSP